MSINNRSRAIKHKWREPWRAPNVPHMGAYFHPHPDEPPRLCLGCLNPLDASLSKCPRCNWARGTIPADAEIIYVPNCPRLLFAASFENDKLEFQVITITNEITLGSETEGLLHRKFSKRSFSKPDVFVESPRNAYVAGQAAFERKGTIVKTIRGGRKFKPNTGSVKRFGEK